MKYASNIELACFRSVWGVGIQLMLGARLACLEQSGAEHVRDVLGERHDVLLERGSKQRLGVCTGLLVCIVKE